MADGTDGTPAEILHAIDFGGDSGGRTEVHQIVEAKEGVDLQVPRRVGVVNPLLFGALEIHVVVQSQGVRPREMLKQLDGRADGHGVFDAGLHIIAQHVFGPTAKVVLDAIEKHGVHTIDVGLAVQRVAHAEALVPAFLARLAYFLQRIEGVDGERDFGQRGCHLPRQGVLAVVGVEGEVDLAAKVGLVADTRLEGVAQLVCGGLGVVFVVVGADDVDVGGEAAFRVRLRVLLVVPMDFEVSALLIVGGTFGAYLVEGKAQSHRTVVLVATVVAESRLDGPRATGVDVAQHLQVIVVVDGPVIAAVFQVETTVGRLAVCGKNETRLLTFRIGNQ